MKKLYVEHHKLELILNVVSGLCFMDMFTLFHLYCKMRVMYGSTAELLSKHILWFSKLLPRATNVLGLNNE